MKLRTPRPARFAFAAFVPVWLALSGCDFEYYAFINSIPVTADVADNPVVYVYLGIDGLDHKTLDEARARGAFAGDDWRLAKFLTMFPASSDVSWSRILHTRPIGGYEYQYYNPTTNTVVSRGYGGLLQHAIPPLESAPGHTPRYYNAFDYSGNGYLNTFEIYQNTFISYATSLDNAFFVLDGRAATQDVFAAYMLEVDVLGHMQTREEVTAAVIALSDRIELFKRTHPERRYLFTLLSDHGMDFIHVPGDNLVRFPDEMVKYGVEPVYDISAADPRSAVFAIPIVHTRVTYLALHTRPELTAAVARRVSRSATLDVALSRVHEPEDAVTGGAPAGIEWFGAWDNGDLVMWFGFDAGRDQYWLPAGIDWGRFDLAIPFEAGDVYRPFADEDLFRLSKNSEYPDLFFRLRTAFEPVSIRYPAEVLVSFAHRYASVGFEIPGGANEIANKGFHGALDAAGSVGIVLTEERELPDAMRSDNFLDFFPRLRQHVLDRGLRVVEGEPNAGLDYRYTQ